MVLPSCRKSPEEITGYQANALNQYTALTVDGDVDFQPEYDADGNQCRVKTSTGIWAISYDAENRPTDFTKVDSSGSTSIHCEYDHMGRRATKKVTVNGSISLHQRYIYRGYLQIAALDLTRAAHPALWYITWDPTQPIATRPLAIQKDGTWYTYGWDLTKNICEVFGPAGYIRTAYTYAPYGEVTSEGDVSQPIQWSSEFNDTELGLVYYNYRHYNPVEGRWIGRDFVRDIFRVNDSCLNLYSIVGNLVSQYTDRLGLLFDERQYAYRKTKIGIKLIGSHWLVIEGLLLHHLYSGNGETVSYDINILHSINETYVRNALGFIKRGYKKMKNGNYYNIWKYDKPIRYISRGVENYMLGDYSLSAAYYIETNKLTKCVSRYDVIIYLEDEFNVKQRSNKMSRQSINFRNNIAWLMNLPTNTSFLVNCQKKYSFNIERNGEDFRIY